MVRKQFHVKHPGITRNQCTKGQEHKKTKGDEEGVEADEIFQSWIRLGRRYADWFFWRLALWWCDNIIAEVEHHYSSDTMEWNMCCRVSEILIWIRVQGAVG